MTTDAISVGLIGYGLAGRLIHVPLLAATPGVRLAAVASSRRSEFPADWPGVTIHDTPEALIADPQVELVVVATPNATHAHWARAAIAAGKNVMVEKPFALSLEEAREILSLASTSKSQLFVFQNRRHDSDYLTIKQIIESGAIGDVTLFESSIERFTPEIQPSWNAPADAGSGIWFDIGPHLIDQALQLFGRPESVFANFASLRSGDGSGAEDWVEAILTYPDKRVVLTMSMFAPAFRTRFRVHGRIASAIKCTADRQGSQYMAGLSPDDPDWGQDPEAAVVSTAAGEETIVQALRGDHRRFYDEVRAAIRGSGPNPTPPTSIVNLMEVLDAGRRSALQGIAVPICSAS